LEDKGKQETTFFEVTHGFQENGCFCVASTYYKYMLQNMYLKKLLGLYIIIQDKEIPSSFSEKCASYHL
jgi:hypothetical protein